MQQDLSVLLMNILGNIYYHTCKKPTSIPYANEIVLRASVVRSSISIQRMWEEKRGMTRTV